MFEWDGEKRQANLAKHGLDFLSVVLFFDGRPLVTAPSSFPSEDRLVSTGMMDDGKFYTVVWTWRADSRRIISFRRARHGEERTYLRLFG
jgi:uncharacterized DUF497 family protein